MTNLIKAEKGYHIQEIRNSSGIIAEKVAQVYTQTSTWKIINKIDLSHIISNGQTINGWIITAMRECRKPCIIYAELRHELTRLNSVNTELERILRLIDKTNVFKREAPIPFVANVFRALFGFLTEKDKEILEGISQRTLNHSSEIAQVVYNTTKIIHTEMANLNNHTAVINRELINLKKDLDEVRRDINLQILVTQIQESIIDFRLQLDTLSQAINLASNGLLHPTLFQSEEWLRAIDIEDLNKINAKFPLSGKEFSLINVAKISEIKIAINKNYLIYLISLPLTDYNSMNLYKITPFAAFNKLGNYSIYSSKK